MDNQRINHSNHRMYHSLTDHQNSNGEISGEYHQLDFQLKHWRYGPWNSVRRSSTFQSKARKVRGMGYSTGIQYGTAVINKVNKPLTTNLNENTWKLIKLVISKAK